MPDQTTVSAVVIRNASGQVLTVRKRGTELLMFPGGKPEPGESPEQAPYGSPPKNSAWNGRSRR